MPRTPSGSEKNCMKNGPENMVQELPERLKKVTRTGVPSFTSSFFMLSIRPRASL